MKSIATDSILRISQLAKSPVKQQEVKNNKRCTSMRKGLGMIKKINNIIYVKPVWFHLMFVLLSHYMKTQIRKHAEALATYSCIKDNLNLVYTVMSYLGSSHADSCRRTSKMNPLLGCLRHLV